MDIIQFVIYEEIKRKVYPNKSILPSLMAKEDFVNNRHG